MITDKVDINKIFDLLGKQGSINSRFDEMFETQINLNDNILTNQNDIIDVLKDLETRIKKLEEKEAN